jgi:hypothetical protein
MTAVFGLAVAGKILTGLKIEICRMTGARAI